MKMCRAGLALLVLVGCKPPTMVVDPSLGSTPMPIVRTGAVRMADATIGPWHTHVNGMEVSREKARISFSTRNVDVNIRFGRAGFFVLTFDLTDGTTTWTTQCRNVDELRMGCVATSGAAAWALQVTKTRKSNVPPVVTATLTSNAGTELDVTQERATAAPPHLFVRGYTARTQGQARGAIEVIGDGRVWIAQDADAAEGGVLISMFYALWLLRSWIDETDAGWKA